MIILSMINLTHLFFENLWKVLKAIRGSLLKGKVNIHNFLSKSNFNQNFIVYLILVKVLLFVVSYIPVQLLRTSYHLKNVFNKGSMSFGKL